LPALESWVKIAQRIILSDLGSPGADRSQTRMRLGYEFESVPLRIHP